MYSHTKNLKSNVFVDGYLHLLFLDITKQRLTQNSYLFVQLKLIEIIWQLDGWQPQVRQGLDAFHSSKHWSIAHLKEYYTETVQVHFLQTYAHRVSNKFHNNGKRCSNCITLTKHRDIDRVSMSWK